MSYEINQFNLSSGLLNKYKNVLFYDSHWHQILVENVEGLERDAVLKPLSKFCRPFDFIPVRYVVAKNSASFLLKNCGHAIEKLCNQNLVIANPHNADKPFKLCVKLCHSHTNDLKINIHINIVNVLNKRYFSETGVLNLENFARDPELEEYCTLAQPKLCFYILHLTKNINFKILKLSNNDIDSLKPLDALEGCRNNIVLDLRNNNITDIEEFNNMRHLTITELFLDGNPICDKFTEVNYGKAIRDKIEKIEKLDGVNIQMKGFLPFRRNYLCNLSGYDLVDQFLDHYFTQYDARNRSILDGLYHKKAMFSINSMYLPAQTTSLTAKLSAYKKYARNLKQISDFSKTSHSLIRGPYDILKVLNTLPFTEHDPFSFTVDLVMYTENSAMIVVCGVYREYSDSLLESDRLLGFTRTFVLLAGSNGEYSIINEMLHVTNATTIQAARAFKQHKVPKPQFIYIPPAQSDKDRSDLADALKTITGLKTEWAHKCLVECNYEMKAALTLFIELFKVDKIPKSAFLSKEDVIKEIRPQSQPQITDTSNIYRHADKIQSAPVPPSMNIAKQNTASNFNQYSSGNENVQSSSVTSVSNILSSLMATQATTSNLTQIKLRSIYDTKELYKEKRKEIDERIPSENPSSSKKNTTYTTKIVKNIETRPLSPDLLWDNFNNSKERSDIIDIISSPEEGNSSDVGGIDTKLLSPLPSSATPAGITPMVPAAQSLPSVDDGTMDNQPRELPKIVRFSPKRFKNWNRNPQRFCYVMVDGVGTKMTRREARLRNLIAGPKESIPVGNKKK